MFDASMIPFVQRLDRDPEDQEAFDALWRHLESRHETQTMGVLAEKVAARRKDPRSAASLLHRAAEVWARLGGNDERAARLWQQVIQAEPEHLGAQAGLAGVYRRAGRTELASRMLQQLLDRVVAPARRVPLLQESAALKAQLGDRDGEIDALRELVRCIGPGAAATDARRSLARALVQRSRDRATTEHADDAPAWSDDVKEAARMLGAIAREGATGRSAEFAQAALQLWPGEETAFQVSLDAGGLRVADQVTLRIKFLAAAPESAMAAAVRNDLADAYVAAGRTDDAIAVLAAFADEDPDAAQKLASIYQRTGRHKDLADLYASLQPPENPAQRLLLFRRRAAAYRTAGRRDAVLAAWRDVLTLAPADPEALGEVERDCRMRGALDELRDRLRAAAAVTTADTASRVKWLREVAQLAERRFDDVDDAVRAWETLGAITEVPAERAEAEEATNRLLARGEKWDGLLTRLEASARAAADPQESRRLWMRWLDVHRVHVRDAAAEAKVLTELWAQSPDDDAVALALIDARRRTGDVAEVTALLRALIERATTATAGMRWSQLAGHLEQSGDIAGATDAWRTARTADPSQAMAWQAEERLLESSGRHAELADVLVAHAGHPLAAGRRAGELYARAAQLAFEHVDAKTAATHAERALRFNPDDAEMQWMLEMAKEGHTAPVSLVAAARETPAEPEPAMDVETEPAMDAEHAPAMDAEPDAASPTPVVDDEPARPTPPSDASPEETGSARPDDDAVAATTRTGEYEVAQPDAPRQPETSSATMEIDALDDAASLSRDEAREPAPPTRTGEFEVAEELAREPGTTTAELEARDDLPPRGTRTLELADPEPASATADQSREAARPEVVARAGEIDAQEEIEEIDDVEVVEELDVSEPSRAHTPSLVAFDDDDRPTGVIRVDQLERELEAAEAERVRDDAARDDDPVDDTAVLARADLNRAIEDAERELAEESAADTAPPQPGAPPDLTAPPAVQVPAVSGTTLQGLQRMAPEATKPATVQVPPAVPRAAPSVVPRARIVTDTPVSSTLSRTPVSPTTPTPDVSDVSLDDATPSATRDATPSATRDAPPLVAPPPVATREAHAEPIVAREAPAEPLAPRDASPVVSRDAAPPVAPVAPPAKLDPVASPPPPQIEPSVIVEDSIIIDDSLFTAPAAPPIAAPAPAMSPPLTRPAASHVAPSMPSHTASMQPPMPSHNVSAKPPMPSHAASMQPPVPSHAAPMQPPMPSHAAPPSAPLTPLQSAPAPALSPLTPLQPPRAPAPLPALQYEPPRPSVPQAPFAPPPLQMAPQVPISPPPLQMAPQAPIAPPPLQMAPQPPITPPPLQMAPQAAIAPPPLQFNPAPVEPAALAPLMISHDVATDDPMAPMATGDPFAIMPDAHAPPAAIAPETSHEVPHSSDPFAQPATSTSDPFAHAAHEPFVPAPTPAQLATQNYERVMLTLFEQALGLRAY